MGNEVLYVAPHVVHKWNDWKYQVIVCGKQIRCVVMGETHMMMEQIQAQASMIELIRPDIVLHESGYAWTYDPNQGGFTLQTDRAVETLDLDTSDRFPDLLINQADRLKHRLVGIDMTFRETEVAYRRLAKEWPQEFVWERVAVGVYQMVKRGNPKYWFTPLDPITFKLRDAHMVRMIQRWEKISQAPLIVIVGSDHARNFHEKGLLRACRFGYAIVNQTRVRIRSR